ncbi:MAG: ABC transporter ATP-binding protein, partial [Bryobacterales bacterium]|nr:ABC transporter ATP-binding protein [Bryobacterales bacterium]
MADANSLHEEESLQPSQDWRMAGRILRWLLPYRKQVAVALTAIAMYALLQTVPPLLSKLAIDSYLASPVQPAPELLQPYLSAQPSTALAQIALLYLLTLLLTFILEFGQSYLMQWTGQQAMFQVRRDLMAKLQELDLAYYDRNPVGRMVTRVTTDVDVLNELFASGLVTAVADILTLLLIVAAMLWLSVPLTLFLLAAVPPVLVATWLFRRASQLGYRQTRVAVAKINSFLNEHVNGIAVLQLFNRQERARASFASVNEEYRAAMKRTVTAYGWFYPVVEVIGVLSLAAILSYSGVLRDEGSVSIGVVAAFFQYGARFFRPIQELSEKYNLLQSAITAGERIFKLLDTPREVSPPALAIPFPEGDRAIEFDR